MLKISKCLLTITTSLFLTASIYAAPKTTIVGTLGPVSNSEAAIEKLVNAGLDTARINFSHGTHESNLKIAESIRAVEKKLGKHIAIMVDLQGPKYRIGKFENKKINLKEGQNFTLDLQDKVGDDKRVTFNHPELYSLLSKGGTLLLDDAAIVLKIKDINKNVISTVVERGGDLSNNKGVNLPTLNAPVKAVTDKDTEDALFAIENIKPDFFALSFVQRAKDIEELRKLIGNNKIGIIAKIEKPQAIANLDEIAQAADGLLVARGDMGVEMGDEKVPVMQRKIIKAAKKYNKPVIVATQMMMTMVSSPLPTRAEANDVATAVYLDADSVMLSNETAVGEYPVETVTMMDKILDYTEQNK